MTGFSGSYAPEDVVFLLKQVHLESTEIAEKEREIQSGRRHYSEMITREKLPSPRYLATFHAAMELEKNRFARHVLALAGLVHKARPNTITLVSLARAGTPIGVLLARILRQKYQRSVHHYSISIIRDRGIDENALHHILQRHDPDSILFVDGWTGKGVIATELNKAITAFNQRWQLNLDPGLFVVSDLCGSSVGSPSTEDYLIPSSVLGATISGLVSRSILNDAVIGPGDFHGCLFYEEYAAEDLSRWFVEQVLAEVDNLLEKGPYPLSTLPCVADLREIQLKSQTFITNIQEKFEIRQLNYIKPGIGESTRVLLRRIPQILLLRDSDRMEVAHLRLLAEEKNVPILIDSTLPYLATALIRELD